MQEYAFDPDLKRCRDLAKLRAAQDPDLIQAYVRDNRLNTYLYSAIYAASEVLKVKEVSDD